ncbi:MAG: exodeoxyribonuclease VII large subunit, partial [Clostridia bacterium]|nr:exodeoxyribonuclease VII large subunit [Clostridia bacterium]
MSSVLTVSQINTYLKAVLDGDDNLQNIFVVGEISNFTNHYRTGHFYFTLKDESAALKAVMFRTAAQRLRFLPENCMRVIIRGSISLFPRDGVYQLYCEDMQPDGAGALSVAFEQLKEKLQKEGLFDPAHKKPLPAYPGTIAIVTSEAGAAVHDMIRFLRRRFPLTKVRLLPVRVQGTEAPAD